MSNSQSFLVSLVAFATLYVISTCSMAQKFDPAKGAYLMSVGARGGTNAINSGLSIKQRLFKNEIGFFSTEIIANIRWPAPSKITLLAEFQAQIDKAGKYNWFVGTGPDIVFEEFVEKNVDTGELEVKSYGEQAINLVAGVEWYLPWPHFVAAVDLKPRFVINQNRFDLMNLGLSVRYFIY